MTAKKPKDQLLKVGRKRKFQSVEAMQIKIDEYFLKCAERTKEVVTKAGELIKVPSPAPLHIQGLCVHLDLSDQGLREYQELPEFSGAILRAKKKCEAYAVDQCYEGQKGNKADFILKNGYGWSDKQQIEYSTVQIVDDIPDDESKTK